MKTVFYLFIVFFFLLACSDFPNNVERDNPNDSLAHYDNQPPIAHLTVTPAEGQYKVTKFTFDATQSVEPELPGTPLYYSWDFRGTGHWSKYVRFGKISGVIARSGYINVKVRVKGGRGLVAVDSATVYCYRQPHVDFGWKKDAHGNILLDAFLSHGFEADYPLTYRWDFNDDHTWDWGWSDSPRAQFDAPDQTPEVLLQVKNRWGLTASAIRKLALVDRNALLAKFDFNGNVKDSGPFYIQASVTGATLTKGRTGLQNTAYHFDGIDDYIRLANRRELNKKNDVNVSFWVKIGKLGQTILSKGNSYYIKSTTNGAILFHTSAYESRTYTNKVKEGAWYFISCNLSSENYLHIFINGISKSAGISHGPLPDNGYGEIILGKDFNGTIDNLNIFNRALSEYEIKTLYHELD